MKVDSNRIVIAALATAVLLGGCDEQPGTPANSSASATGARGAGPDTAGTANSPTAEARRRPPEIPLPMSGTAAQTGAASPSGSAAAPLIAMTDEEICSVLESANDKEIDESKAVMDKLSDAEIKAFAKMMMEHHGEAKASQKKLVDKLALKPADNADATKLKEETTKEVDRLKKLTGGELDKEYIGLMVRDHRMTLDDLDKKIIPSIKNAELKKMVESEVRPTVESHLKVAEAHAKRLGVVALSGESK